MYISRGPIGTGPIYWPSCLTTQMDGLRSDLSSANSERAISDPCRRSDSLKSQTSTGHTTRASNAAKGIRVLRCCGRSFQCSVLPGRNSAVLWTKILYYVVAPLVEVNGASLKHATLPRPWRRLHARVISLPQPRAEPGVYIASRASHNLNVLCKYTVGKPPSLK